ncbi:phosphopantetheine-binding protein [Nostoc sp. CHAB 5715]|uniref:phosphopantetheine-binding protein n=1 Tax=Nostoc sp. CHAB 5715 TaxID=2780400 RepID=UPI001E53F578|nr:phosphopantetheine-binding protein [Nostoc sp. CHAB 5715]MCC5620763.1 phosphopantetheine-binding protein [Nostoc sp. CHAB 5715]
MQLRIAGLSLQDIDPYQFEPQTTEVEVAKGSRVSITLNGSNYVSDKTKATFEKALQDGHKIQPSILNRAELQPDIQHSLVNQFQNNSVNQSVSAEVINSNTNVTSPESTDVNINVISSQQLEPTNANADTIPAEVVTVTSPYTPTDTADSTDSYFIIPIIESNEMLQPISPSRSNIEQIVGTGLEKLLTQFCNHQSEILRVHEQYLKNQAECSQSFFQLMQQQYRVLLGSNNIKSQQVELALEQTPVAPQIPANTVASSTPVDAPQTNSVNNTLTIVSPAKVESSSPETKSVASVETVDRVELLMQVISSKTGYPVTMLNWEINPRADLGIDAVKWMDIISAIQELLPDVPKVNPKELAEQPTLRQVAEYIQICVPQPSPSPQVPVSTSAKFF